MVVVAQRAGAAGPRSTNVLTNAGSPYGGVPDHYVGVSVINAGRAAATVQSWGIEEPSGKSIVVTSPWAFSDKLPARVEPARLGDLLCTREDVRKHAEERGAPYKKLRPWVQVATGKKVYARKGVPLA